MQRNTMRGLQNDKILIAYNSIYVTKRQALLEPLDSSCKYNVCSQEIDLAVITAECCKDVGFYFDLSRTA